MLTRARVLETLADVDLVRAVVVQRVDDAHYFAATSSPSSMSAAIARLLEMVRGVSLN